MKKNLKAEDRKRVLAALRAEQAFEDAENAVELATEKVDKAFHQMVDGEDLKGLLELEKILNELKSSFEKSDAYVVIMSMLQDSIEDAQKDAAKA